MSGLDSTVSGAIERPVQGTLLHCVGRSWQMLQEHTPWMQKAGLSAMQTSILFAANVCATPKVTEIPKFL